MKERLLKLMEELNLTSTKLAEEIGVQRSSISHILSERNKPSFDFIRKLIEKYPEINPKWLLLGEGSMYLKERQSSIPFHEDATKNDRQLTSPESHIQNQSLSDEQIKESETNNTQKTTLKPIKRIVIFYADNSFEEYLPEDNK